MLVNAKKNEQEQLQNEIVKENESKQKVFSDDLGKTSRRMNDENEVNIDHEVETSEIKLEIKQLRSALKSFTEKQVVEQTCQTDEHLEIPYKFNGQLWLPTLSSIKKLLEKNMTGK